MTSKYYTYNGLTVSNGNKKIGDDTLIFNLTSATDCPSKALGLCKIPKGKCYALKAEKLYPNTLPYRRRQAEYWDKHPHYFAIAMDFIGLFDKHPTLKKRIKYVRFNESGDFRNQADIDKMDLLAYFINKDRKYNNLQPLIWYGYSARSDLDFSNAADLLVKGSGHDQGNNGRVDSLVWSHWSDDLNSTRYRVCPGKCASCAICKTRSDTRLIIPMH